MTREVGDMGTPTVTRIFQLWSQDVGWYNHHIRINQGCWRLLNCIVYLVMMNTKTAHFLRGLLVQLGDSLGEGKKPHYANGDHHPRTMHETTTNNFIYVKRNIEIPKALSFHIFQIFQVISDISIEIYEQATRYIGNYRDPWRVNG